MTQGLVSIVIPTFNCESIIKDCLESVKNQTYKQLEIIVVDSFSTDSTAEIAKKYAKVYSFGKSPEQKNIFAAPFQRNYGASKAKGEYIYWIDSDMRLTPQLIKSCVEFIEKVKADAIIVPEVSYGESFWAKCRALEKSIYNKSARSYTDAARFIRQDAWRKLDGLDASLGGVDDFDFQARLDTGGFKTAKIKSHVYHYEGNLTLRKQIIKKFIYGKTALNYFKKYKQNKGFLLKQYIRPEFFNHIDLLAKQPIHTLGMIFMKLVEYSAALTGMLYSIVKKETFKPIEI